MPRNLDIPPHILRSIRDGRAILFLGAGASLGATSSDGKIHAPTGPQLAAAISNEFLGGKRATDPLAKVADYASTEASLLDLQLFVKKLLNPLEPTKFHKIIPLFKWKLIVTTNYDQIIEKSYDAEKGRIQTPLVIIRDGDMRSIEDTDNPVPIIKIHGCISQASDTSLPMVIANEQYAKYAKGRQRLATEFRESAKDHPVVFCGYNLSDPHIVEILYSLEDGLQDRPHYLDVAPSLDEFDRRYWADHRVNTCTATFEEFLVQIDKLIPTKERFLGQLFTHTFGSLSKHLKVGSSLSQHLQAILAGRLTHVHQDLAVENVDPATFYKGYSQSWSPIKSDLDFARKVNSKIIADINTDATTTSFVLLRGHAGSGKTVSLRRIAWELSTFSKDLVVFYCENSLHGVRDVLSELHLATNQRIVLVLDNALHDLDSLNECLSYAHRNNIPLTILAGARTNEWNSTDTPTSIAPTSEYTIGDISQPEAAALCDLLEKHGCSGELVHLNQEERIKRLMDNNERQLLVTLYEATMGAGLRKILRDEYKNIAPPEAQILYLDICSLHRLGVVVRAGLISRMSGISFHQFRERFISPLDRVVITYSDWRSKDFAYKTRHQEIASIVFEEALSTPQDRANQIAKILSYLNTDYSSDNDAASQLLKGRVIADTFHDYALAQNIFESAEQSGISRTFLLQQKAIFESKHPGGSLDTALKLINEALVGASSHKGPLHHTKAVIMRDMARKQGMDPALVDRHRENALDELREHGLIRSSAYGLVTYCEILLDQVKARLENVETSSIRNLTEEAALKKIGDLERSLSDGLQRWPNDTHLAAINADFNRVVDRAPQALHILRSAFERTPGNEFIALRLARLLLDKGRTEDIEEAIKILRRAVSTNPSSKSINFLLARVLMRHSGEESSASEVGHLLRRSFTEGDTHFEAQFWHARHEFLYGDRNRSKKIYEGFSSRRAPYVDASERKGVIENDDGSPKSFQGFVRSLKGDFCFVDCASLSSSLFLHRSQIEGCRWEDIQIGDRLSFHVAFSFKGPQCIDASII